MHALEPHRGTLVFNERGWVEALARDGYAMAGTVPEGLLAALTPELANAFPATGRRRGGFRHAFDALKQVRVVARAAPVRALAEAVLGRGCFAVRALLFDKTPAANWSLGWHQDFAVAVRERHEVTGFGPWTVKQGVPHAYAPATLLERMLAVRIHLDDCGPENGPLSVLPGSHRHGRLLDEEIREHRTQTPPVECTARRGEVLAMRPLLLHASTQALNPAHRRVLHLEFAAEELPEPLHWRWTV
jgi:ectoine hydroxylase-related dioxygenase (phytanoyl-CoA dioxygenase family)